MTKAELEELADKYYKKADRALLRYQETGEQRHYREYVNNEDLSDALTMAANAEEDYTELRNIKSDLTRLARMVEREETPEAINQNILATAKLHKLIGAAAGRESMKEK